MARASDSVTGYKPLRFPHPPKALRMTRTPWLSPVSSRHLSPSSSLVRQSPQSRPILPAASPELPFSLHYTPLPALPPSPCPFSPLAPPPPPSFSPPSLPLPHLPLRFP